MASSGDQAHDEARPSAELDQGLTPELRGKLIDAEAEVQRQATELAKLAIEQDTALYQADVPDGSSATPRRPSMPTPPCSSSG